VFTEPLHLEHVYRVFASGTCLPSLCLGNVFSEPLSCERVYRAVSAGTFLSSRCPGNFGDDMDTRKGCVCRPSLRCAVVRGALLHQDGILNSYHRSIGSSVAFEFVDAGTCACVARQPANNAALVLLRSRPTMRGDENMLPRKRVFRAFT
jgi:hypothetical protein